LGLGGLPEKTRIILTPTILLANCYDDGDEEEEKQSVISAAPRDTS